MYLSKTKKRNIIIFVLVLLLAMAGTAFLLLQKPKIETVVIEGSGYTGSSLVVNIMPLEATVSYQWLVSSSANGTYTELSGATTNTLSLSIQDEGNFYKVLVRGIEKYAGSLESVAFGPIKGVSITWPSSTPITYGQSLIDCVLGEGSALINGIYVPGSFGFEDPSATPNTAGIYKAKIVFTPTDLSKYKAISSNIDITVNKARLTVTVEDVSVTYGDFLSDLKYTITGYLFSDDDSVVTGSPSITSVYSAGTSVTYNPIQLIGDVGSLSSHNYDFDFVYGQLTINKRTLTITGLSGKDKTYDGTTKASATGKARLVGIFFGDDVYLGGYGSFNFVQKDVGKNIKITTKGYTLKGSKAINYTLIQPTLYADINAVIIP